MIPWARLKPAPADRVRPSPNQNARPSSAPDLACIVLHATADGGSEAGAESWMTEQISSASAHLHLRRDGTVVRLVPDTRRAWHAGVSRWRGRSGVNDFSLGWEIANRNDGREPYTDAQYAVLARLAAHYVRQGLPLEAFVSHAAIALPKGRKTDPAGFDWTRFHTGVREQLRSTAARSAKHA